MATMSALAEKDKVTSILWASAAIAKLGEARNFRAGLGLSTINLVSVAATYKALEAHFHISTATIPNIDFIEQVLAIYGKTLNILNHSANFFADDTTSAEAAEGVPAHVPWGLGKVRFTPAFKERDKTAKPPTGLGNLCRAAMVLHEPVHIVDHPFASQTANHVYEHSAQYATQPAANQLHNCSSYASFGQQAFYGIDTRYGAGRPDD